MEGVGLSVILAVGVWGLLLYYLVVGWLLRYLGQRATVVTLYNPPPGISPALAAYFFNPGDSLISLAACLVDLAERGSIRLTRVPGGYYVEPADESVELHWWERQVRERLSESTLSPTTVSDASAFLNSLLEREVTPKYVSPHNFLFFFPVILPAVVALRLLSAHLDRAGRIALVGMVAMLYWASISLGTFGTKTTPWNPDQEQLRSPMLVNVNAVWLTLLAVGLLCLFATLTGMLLPLIVAFLVVSFFGRSLLRAPSKEGWELYTRLQGFKTFMSSVEADSIKAVSASTELPQQTQDHLAFAVAFGIKRSWTSDLLLFLSDGTGRRRGRELAEPPNTLQQQD